MKPTILFIDDEERILRSLKMLFMADYNVRITTDHHEALAILKKETVHAIISDQRMPAITGVELLREARIVSEHTMRILLTGYSDLMAIVSSVNEGEIFRYISKPWIGNELKIAVRNAVDIADKLINSKANPVDVKKSLIPHDNCDLLVIDSDKNIFNEIYNLYSINCKAHYADNIEDAFEILSYNSRISIIICDLFIDGEDISTGIKMLKQHNPSILTIVATCFQDANALIKLVNEGQVYRFLPKPVSIKLLVKSIDEAISYHNVLMQTPQLTTRHAVNKQEQQVAGSGLSFKIMNYFKKIATAKI